MTYKWLAVHLPKDILLSKIRGASRRIYLALLPPCNRNGTSQKDNAGT